MSAIEIMRMPEVMRVTGLPKSTLYAMMAQGRFPKARKLGGSRAAGWLRSEVEGWIGGLEKQPEVSAHPAPLTEGQVMGSYMEFDRTADKSWTNAEYLVKFGMFISERTVKP